MSNVSEKCHEIRALLKSSESNECSRYDLMQFNLSSETDTLICITLNNGILDENDVVMMIF